MPVSINYHICGYKDLNIELSRENQVVDGRKYRTLQLDSLLALNNATIYLTTEQAEMIATTILEQLEADRKGVA